MAPKLRDIPGYRSRCPLLHAAIRVEDLRTQGRERSAAARLPALGGGDQWRSKARIHRVYQYPGPFVAHAQPAAGGGDRAGGVDAFEQIGLAGSERHFRTKVDP